MPEPEPAPAPRPEAIKLPLEFTNSWSQLSDEQWIVESVANDPKAKTATPREINRIGPDSQVHMTPRAAMVSKEVQLRPWMIDRIIMFDQPMAQFRLEDSQTRLKRHKPYTGTPLYLVFPDLSDLRVVWITSENMLPSGAEKDTLPKLEPITDWSWLNTMGLARS